MNNEEDHDEHYMRHCFSVLDGLPPWCQLTNARHGHVLDNSAGFLMRLIFQAPPRCSHLDNHHGHVIIHTGSANKHERRRRRYFSSRVNNKVGSEDLHFTHFSPAPFSAQNFGKFSSDHHETPSSSIVANKDDLESRDNVLEKSLRSNVAKFRFT